MKKNIIFTLAIIISSLSFMQAQTYEELYDKIEFEKLAKQVVENTITKFEERGANIPKSKWDEIRTEINYSRYKTEVVNILKANYTLSELEEIFLQNKAVEPINDTGIFLFKPKRVVQNQLYAVSKRAGKYYMNQILEKVGVTTAP